jgi:ubiquinone/menaquinone biosynthesis C-methylase UbiE
MTTVIQTVFVTSAVMASAVVLGGCLHSGAARDRWQKPDRVVESLRIEPGARIADLGAGDGYFTFRLAEATGPDGAVLAVDIDEQKLDALHAEARERGLLQVRVVVAEQTDSRLEPASVDLIFVCNTYHHLEERVAYFARLRSRLRPGGRVAVVELDDTPWFMPFMSAHETTAETIDREMSAAGYTRVASHDFLEYQNFQIFTASENGTKPP